MHYRESESKLIAVLSVNPYSGGGTMQINTKSVVSLEITKKRLTDLYHHLLWMAD